MRILIVTHITGEEVIDVDNSSPNTWIFKAFCGICVVVVMVAISLVLMFRFKKPKCTCVK